MKCKNCGHDEKTHELRHCWHIMRRISNPHYSENHYCKFRKLMFADHAIESIEQQVTKDLFPERLESQQMGINRLLGQGKE